MWPLICILTGMCCLSLLWESICPLAKVITRAGDYVSLRQIRKHNFFRYFIYETGSLTKWFHLDLKVSFLCLNKHCIHPCVIKKEFWLNAIHEECLNADCPLRHRTFAVLFVFLLPSVWEEILLILKYNSRHFFFLCAGKQILLYIAKGNYVYYFESYRELI